MIHYTKVLNGLSTYIEREIIAQFSGSYKSWIAGAATGVIMNKGSQFVAALAQAPLVKALGVMDGEMIDEELLYRELLKQAQKTSATITLPIIGPITFTVNDVEALHRYIMGG